MPEAQEHVRITHVPAHVTVLFPFLDSADVDHEKLRIVFADFDAFDFVLDRVERFEAGTVWLHPEPSRPFADLTAAVWARWPDHPPYEGIHDEVIPHVTVSPEPVDVDVPLPIRSRAGEVTLIEEVEPDVWIERASFPLGGK